MTANDSKSYLAYLNKLQLKITIVIFLITVIFIIILSIKNLLMLTILLWLEKLRQILKLLSLKLIIESELLSIRTFLVMVTLKIGQNKYLGSFLC